MIFVTRIVALAAFLVAALSPAHAQKTDPVADFYRGKTIRLIVGYGTGGSYDLYGRLAAEFLGRHIPGNPTIVTVNMPGAGGLKAVDYLYKVAPQDGPILAVLSATRDDLARQRQDGHRPDLLQLSRRLSR
jgi:tripartite-type tricarboxylate transporter receptor subunit TctC